MTEPTVITTEDEYVRCKDQVHRQTIERDALNLTIADISNACAVWEAEHPAPADPEAQP